MSATQGIVCPKCGCRHFFVVWTRQRIGGITRARSCRHCGRRILTREALLADEKKAADVPLA